MPLLCASGSLTAKGFGFTSQVPFGEVVYTDSADSVYTFIVPIGVTQVSILAIGAGGGGPQICDWTTRSDPNSVYYTAGSSSASIKAGGGGALAYVNNIAVTPGESLTVNVPGRANGGTISTDYGNGVGYGKNGGTASVYRGATPLVAAGGGKGDGTGTGGTVLTGTGYAGGNGGEHWAHSSYILSGGGGGGAGGYSGAGGNGGDAGGITSPTAGSGGGGGGGGAGNDFNWTTIYDVDIGAAGAGGGGVGVYGEGTSGAAGSNATGGSVAPNSGNISTGGGGGSSGTAGSNIGISTSAHVPGQGGIYGGGGGMGGTRISDSTPPQYVGAVGANSAQGVVRIIWSTLATVPRQFPSTNVGQL